MIGRFLASLAEYHVDVLLVQTRFAGSEVLHVLL